MEPTYTKAQWVAGVIVMAAIAALVTFMAVSMWNAAFPSSFGPECEALYNQYTETVDMATREVLFSKGFENGCFHYN